MGSHLRLGAEGMECESAATRCAAWAWSNAQGADLAIRLHTYFALGMLVRPRRLLAL